MIKSLSTHKRTVLLILTTIIIVVSIFLFVLLWQKKYSHDDSETVKRVESPSNVEQENRETMDELTSTREPSIQMQEWGVEMLVRETISPYEVKLVAQDSIERYEVTMPVEGCWDIARQQDAEVATPASVGIITRYVSSQVITAEDGMIDTSAVGSTWGEYLTNSNQYIDDGYGDAARQIGDYTYSLIGPQAPCGASNTPSGQRANQEHAEKVREFRRDIFSSLRVSGQ